MEKLGASYSEMIKNHEGLKSLMILAQSHVKYIPNYAKNREALCKFVQVLPEEIQSIYDKQSAPRSFYKVADSIANCPHDQYWIALQDWLRKVLLKTCHFVPQLTDSNKMNVALGNSIASWLYDHVDLLDAACFVGMWLWSKLAQEGDEEPQVLLRLPILVLTFRRDVQPIMHSLLKETKNEIWEMRKKYFIFPYSPEQEPALDHEEEK